MSVRPVARLVPLVVLAAVAGLVGPAPATAADRLTVRLPATVVLPDTGCRQVAASATVRVRPGARVALSGRVVAVLDGGRVPVGSQEVGTKRDGNRDGVVRWAGSGTVCAADIPQGFLPDGSRVRAEVTVVARERRPGPDRVSRETVRVTVVV